MSSETSTFATRIVHQGTRPVAQKVPVVRLTYALPGGPEATVQLAAPVIRVGSAPRGNDLVLGDETVSRYHFEIRWDELGARIRDLDSTNGTLVDGYRIHDMYLRPGSAIEAGRARILFVPEGREVEESLSPSDSFGPLVGRSPAMRHLFAVLERVAPTEATVLVEGETGTGKELVASAIHGASGRRLGPFVVVDCASVPSSMLPSELFGHERGAFTGADRQRVGLVEEAHGGTLFLDEIGELPLELQPNLLRVLETRVVRRLGSSESRSVDLRVVAATNRDLAREVNRGSFREDLYYRLSVVKVAVPPLRQRREDIPLLVQRFVRQGFRSDPTRAETVLETFSPAALEALSTHPWRGNVRELRNAVERTLALGEVDLPGVEPARGLGGAPCDGGEDPDLSVAMAISLEEPLVEQRAELVDRFERAYLSAMFERHGRKISPAARAAGIDRMYFKRLMKKRGL